MNIQIFGKNKCFDTKKAQRYFKERNIKFLMNNSIPNTPKIYKMLYKNNEFNGYIMEYIEGTITFRESLNKNIDFMDKLSEKEGKTPEQIGAQLNKPGDRKSVV